MLCSWTMMVMRATSRPEPAGDGAPQPRQPIESMYAIISKWCSN